MRLVQTIVTSIAFQKLINQKRLSAFFGWLAGGKLPPFLLRRTITSFIRSNGIDMSEYDFDLEKAKTFNEFFIRKLKPGARSFRGRISACADGYVSMHGKLEGDTLVQAKGRTYSIDELTRDGLPFHGGSYVTIYLSPGDYHRVHMPFDGVIRSVKRIPGQLYSVNSSTLEKIDKLYCRNERVVIGGTWEGGRFCLVLVGAIVVGKIGLSFTHDVREFNKPYPFDLPLSRGDELGYFMLGSTAILVIDDHLLEKIPFSINQKVRMGEELC